MEAITRLFKNKTTLYIIAGLILAAGAYYFYESRRRKKLRDEFKAKMMAASASDTYRKDIERRAAGAGVTYEIRLEIEADWLFPKNILKPIK